jgi:hypothetical protein
MNNNNNNNKVMIRGVRKSVDKGGEGNELHAISLDGNIIRLIDDYKPFLDVNYHYLFELFPSNDIPFVHFLIFVIWFVSPFRFSIQKLDLFSLFLHFKGFPFHAFLFHIKNKHIVKC